MRGRATVEADAAAALARALRLDARAAGLEAAPVETRSRDWCSATFSGERVAMTLRVVGDPAAWLLRLPESDLPMRGWFAADLAGASAGPGAVAVEALVLRKG